jgi:RNA polymerase sigma-70 factor (ECF subfamily)
MDILHFGKQIKAAKKGDEAAFQEVFRTLYRPIYRFLVARTSSLQDAEDLTQSVFMKAWMAIQDGRVTQSPPLAYLYTLARNALIDTWRKQHLTDVLTEEVEAGLVDPQPLVSEVLAVRQEFVPIGRLISGLPPDQRSVLMMKFMDEMTTEEIAAALGKTEVAIRQIQSRALRAVRSQMVSAQI